MTPSTALLVLIGVIIIGYMSCGLIWQWWAWDEEDEEQLRGADFQEGFKE